MAELLKYQFTPNAVKDLCDLQIFLEKKGEKGVFVLLKKRISASISILQKFPNLGTFHVETGARIFPVPKTRYIIFFQKKENILEILRIYHASQKWISNF